MSSCTAAEPQHGYGAVLAVAAAVVPGQPAHPPTNDGVMALDHAPGKVAIFGACRFSIEWADFLGAMGSDMAVVCEHERILPGEDAELAGFLQLVLEERGVRFVLGAQVEAVDGAKVMTSLGAHSRRDRVRR